MDTYASLTEIMETRRSEIHDRYTPQDTTEIELRIKNIQEKIHMVEIAIMAYKKRFFIGRLLHKDAHQDDVDTLNTYKEELKQAKDELARIKDINYSISNNQEIALEEYRDIESTIRAELDIRDNARGDIDFIRACIDYNIDNVKLADDSIADLAYIHMLQRLKTTMLSRNELEYHGLTDKEIDDIYRRIDDVCVELENPKQVKEGTYKVPHKYLREAILHGYEGYCDELTHPSAMGPNHDFVGYAYSPYVENDGTMNETKGKMMEQIYDDPDKYMYLHNISYDGSRYEDEHLMEIINSICRKGLRLTSPGNEFGKIEYTTLNTHDYPHMTFVNYLAYIGLDSGIIVLQIPKNTIDYNQDCIGWNKVLGECNYREELYVLPEYVVGYTYKGTLQRNPIPLEKRQDFRANYFKLSGELKGKEYQH